MFCCRPRRQISPDYTDFLSGGPKRPKPLVTEPGHPHLKPIQGTVRPATKVPCDYKKRPEVKARHLSPVGERPGPPSREGDGPRDAKSCEAEGPRDNQRGQLWPR